MSHSKYHENKNKADLSESQEQEDSQESTNELEFAARSTLENQLTMKEMEAEEFKTKYMRSQAELDNVRKRAERDVSNAYKYGGEKLINDLFPVIDSLAHGLTGAEPSDPKLKMIRDGLKMTLSLLEKALEKNGVEIINPAKGTPFDPGQHQAMSTVSDPNCKSNTIIEVMQKGYVLNGRVLRAALVVVCQ